LNNSLAVQCSYYWPVFITGRFLLLAGFYYWPVFITGRFLLLAGFYYWPAFITGRFLLIDARLSVGQKKLVFDELGHLAYPILMRNHPNRGWFDRKIGKSCWFLTKQGGRKALCAQFRPARIFIQLSLFAGGHLTDLLLSPILANV
jgi:hypothetical protein